MVLFVQTVNGFQSLTIFTKSSILDVDKVLDMPLNNVTAPQEPVTSNNFFLSQLWIIFSTYRLDICLYVFTSSFAFTVIVKVNVLAALSQIPYQTNQL